MTSNALEIAWDHKQTPSRTGATLFRQIVTRGAGALLTPIAFMLGSGHLLSALLGKAVDRKGRPIPWYTYPAIDLLKQHSFVGKRVLELGGGQSTRWWLGRGAQVVTIEEDAGWAQALSQTDAEVHHVPIDPINRTIEDIRRIVSGRVFDVIVIDGHLREESALYLPRHLAESGAMILDNSEGYGLQATIARLGLSQVPFWGHCPGVWRRQCTTIAFRGECFLFTHSPRSSTGN